MPQELNAALKGLFFLFQSNEDGSIEAFAQTSLSYINGRKRLGRAYYVTATTAVYEKFGTIVTLHQPKEGQNVEKY